MRILTPLLILFCSFLPAAYAYEYERILHYHSDIYIENNSEVTVKEKITVYSTRSRIRRGIFRDLPLYYDYKGGNIHIDFELLGVKRNGSPEPHHTERMSNGIRIYVGDENKFISKGKHTYEISYRVDHVLLFYEDFDEIYWNVNGNGWEFDIDSISATVHYPKSAGLLQYDGYTGYYGDNGKHFETAIDSGKVMFWGTKKLFAKQNLSVAVSWEKGHIEYPSIWRKMWFWIRSYFVWIVCILGLILSFGYNFFLWFKYGRDPKPGTIIPLFYPPEDFSPAECAYLNKEGRATDEMFGAQLVQLASKGYLTIEKKKKNYTITRNPDKQHKQELNDVEESFFLSLFGTKDSLYISSSYNARVKKASDQLKNKTDKKQKGIYFLRNNHLKWRQYLLPLITAIIAFLGLSFFGGALYIIIVTLVLMLIKNGIFSRLYEQPTKLGRKKMDEIEGFKMYMKYADKLRIKANNPPSMDFDYFEKNLPYAIALGVADEWKNQFNVQEIEQHYQTRMPYMTGIAFAALGGGFSKDFSSRVSAASTPPSSSSGGSGGFSSGGGFSGGGFGGGGGGGW